MPGPERLSAVERRSATEHALDLALVGLHQALARAMHAVQEAERSLLEYERRLELTKARLRSLGYLVPKRGV